MSAKKILIAEDNRANRLALVELLDMLGYNHETTTDGNEAITAFATHDYDLILMDIAMPQCDGFEATKSIRHLEQMSSRKRTPIIALTASQEKDRCFATGMDDYLEKPYSLESLKEMLEHWLK